jgi:LPXTG-site transpeptidase (sortase) family protein
MNFTVGKTPLYVTLGDFNGDGRQDLATANIESSDVSILLNICNTIPTVTVEKVALQSDPTNASTINFVATFSEPIDATSFTDTDIMLGGTAGAAMLVITETAPNNGTTFNIAVSGMTSSGTVTVFIPANNIQDLDGNGNIASTSIDSMVMYDDIFPTVLSTSLQTAYNTVGPNSLIVIFSEDLNNAGGGGNADDVTNPNNYLIVEAGVNRTFETASCSGGLASDDTKSSISNVTYIPNTAIVNLESDLPVGNYRLFVCGTTFVSDLAGNHLGDGIDFNFNFTVNALPTTAVITSTTSETGLNERVTIPGTGFAPSSTISLPQQPVSLAYTKLGDLWLEIPALKMKVNIVGVPQSENAWDVKWLGDDAGWLNGTAFPTWQGNSVITGHVYGSNGLPGIFVNLKDLKYGYQIIVHLYGEKYIFEVRAMRLVRPETTNYALEHLEGASYLTLITCQGYDPQNNIYRFRRIVRAVLMDVQAE